VSIVIAQAKILRVLKLISLLKSRSKSIEELAGIMETTGRSVYRYLDLLEELGFIIDKDFNNRFFIHSEEDENTLAFDSDEAVLVKDLLNSTAKDHPLKDRVLKKLYLHSDLNALSTNLLKAKSGLILRKIGEGIRNNVRITLRSYHSAHGEDIRDRWVEPVSFSENYETLAAIDIEDQVIKHFKIDRIEDIKTSNKRRKLFQSQPKIQTDIFGMQSDKETMVKLKLKLRAYLLLKEEFPDSEKYISKQGLSYLIKIPVRSYEGIGRFVLGLIDLVEIIGPKDFKEFIREKLAKSNI